MNEHLGVSRHWEVSSEKLGVLEPKIIPIPLARFAVNGEFPSAKLLLITLDRLWQRIQSPSWPFRPYICIFKFQEVYHLLPEAVDVFIFQHQLVMKGHPKITYGVYDQLNEEIAETLNVGFGANEEVLVARKETDERPILIGDQRKIERYRDPYRALCEVKQWADGGPFSREVLGKKRTTLLNYMYDDGIVIKTPKRWWPNHAYYRAVKL